MDTFPENTLTQNVIKLPHRFDITEKWEVKLSEIQYLISWYNGSKGDVQLEMYQIDASSSKTAQ